MIRKLKICCIKNPHEAELAHKAGATCLGLVGAMPSGPGILSDDAIRGIIRSAPPTATCVLLSSESTPESLIAHAESVGATTVQCVRRFSARDLQVIRERALKLALIQVVHVIGEESYDYALSVAGHVNALLLDTGQVGPSAVELGGTGRVHDWRFSVRIVRESSVPIYLARGINARNIADAVAIVRPAGIDLCSALRNERDELDPRKLDEFIAALGPMFTPEYGPFA